MDNIQHGKIIMAHGSGGADSSALMRDIFAKHFENEVLARLEDSAVVDIQTVPGIDPGSPDRIAVSTDSFVVTPQAGISASLRSAARSTTF